MRGISFFDYFKGNPAILPTIKILSHVLSHNMLEHYFNLSKSNCSAFGRTISLSPIWF